MQVGRLETQVKRYKSDAERAEGVEDELKQEKRKLQREVGVKRDELSMSENQRSQTPDHHCHPHQNITG